ncbi:MAG TPA: response regulator, partial [Bryobacteraceae bacterium]
MSTVRSLRHSLRTPLNHIVGYAEILRDEAGGRGASLMSEIAAVARRVADTIQIAAGMDEDDDDLGLANLREQIRPDLEEILHLLANFASISNGAFKGDLGKLRTAVDDLLAFARGAEAPEMDPAPEPGVTTPPPPRTFGRILVVDDDESNREILCRRLGHQGFTAVAEASGPAALARMDGEPFDLVLLDLLMPEMDGFAVLSEMKAHPGRRDIPVVVLSALDDVESAVRSIEMGAEDFLEKPIQSVLLNARIGAIFRRRAVEAERAELAGSLELLLESTGDGVFGADREGKCTFINRAALEMLGYSREELLGQDLHARIHATRRDGSAHSAADCPIRRVLETGVPERLSGDQFFRSDGSSFPADCAVHPVIREGRVDGVVATFNDISERRRNEEHLLQSAKLESLGVLAGGIAHDFNNILTGVLGNASLVLETLEPSDMNHGLLEEVVNATERAADLTRQILAFAGKGQFVIEPVDLSRAIEDLKGLLETSLPKPAKLRFELTRDLPPVDADLRQVQQVIFNLVINAGEAIGERPGTVLVETGVRDLPEGAPEAPPFGKLPPGHYVYVAVKDTGSGIDAATRARIFDPFFTTKFMGRGLGLPAAMGIARSHRGAIHVESEPGRGSRFEVLLPSNASGRPAGGAILVVDDEEIVRRTTRSVLERKGYRVLTAENGQQAVDVFREHADDVALILLDLTMPVMDGAEAVRYLRTIRHDVPILVSSGYNESDVARRFTGNRVTGFVRKPYRAGALLEKI